MIEERRVFWCGRRGDWDAQQLALESQSEAMRVARIRDYTIPGCEDIAADFIRSGRSLEEFTLAQCLHRKHNLKTS